MLGPSFLPGPDEAPRCAVHSENLGVDPGGSALWVDEIIVVDLVRPWPKPVWTTAGFTEVPKWVMAAGESGRRVRVLAAVPLGDHARARIVVHRRVANSAAMVRTEHRCVPEGVADLLRVVLVDGLDASPETVVATPSPVREVLVCTQGSHDVCCGSRGTSLAAEIAAARPDLVVREVSHTGGHRFAPTGITLPDGRMWGLIGADEMLAVIDRAGSPSNLAKFCRGWTGAHGPGQVAERAVMALVDDWEFDDLVRTVDVEPSVTGWRCVVRCGDRMWEVDVEPGRDVPAISCGEPGGGATKPGLEYLVPAPPRPIRGGS